MHDSAPCIEDVSGVYVSDGEVNQIVERGALCRTDMAFDGAPYTTIDLSEIDTQMKSVPTQEAFIGKMVGAMRYFFGRRDGSYSDHFPQQNDENFPFKGFVFNGPPGSGKTEGVKEAGRRLHRELANEGIEVRLFLIGPGHISHKNYGESEQRMRRVFQDARDKGNNNTRTILLFDDVDTLLLSRDDSRAQEWTGALNSEFFHAVDKLQTNHTMIMATTNKEQSLDDAVKSRLWVEDAPAPTLDEMKTIAGSAIPMKIVNGKTPDEMLKLAGERIEHHLADGRDASFRLARMAGIEGLIREVVGWE